MRARFIASCLIGMVLADQASAQGFTPEEAVKRMKLPEGFSARCVAHEPVIRQPVSISFDNRGRLWVLQYLQYPNYAGLKPLQRDQYLRTHWDKVPEPPPHGPKGADKLTILFDPDEHGVFRKSKDFVTGLNIASGFCLGNGGVYIVQAPYLLFYPDKNEDDLPDADPEVLLTGFGMDDTHSLANSLQFGPDGWLYGAAGSTSTCKIKNPANPHEVLEFQQGIWRYHPKTRQFELFSEGGGNTYGLDFDPHGQAIAGTNWGGVAMLHQMQGAYYVKGFSKHGPLHNPNAYGYFEHVPYTGFKGGHVTCGGIIYQGDTYPREYQNQYIAANLLSNAVYWHKLEPVQSSFQARHGGELIEANDSWFRPVDLLQGPDGCVYVVDFYDKRAAHLDPVDNWDKTNGRIYRIEYEGGPQYPTFDLRNKTTAELAELLKHPNVWWRREARQLIVDRGDTRIHPKLRQWLMNDHGQLALEALWTLYASDGWTGRDFDYVGKHESDWIRTWAIRFLVDDGHVSEEAVAELNRLAATERSPVVLAQLASSAKRLEPPSASAVATSLLDNPVCATDPQLPLLIWWAMEAANTRDTTDTVRFPFPQNPKLQAFFLERTARRFMSGHISRGLERIGNLYELARSSKAEMTPFFRGIATALQAHPLESVPESLRGGLEESRREKPRDLLILEVFARMNDLPARVTLRTIVADRTATDGERIKAAELLRHVRDPQARELFLSELAAKEQTEAVRISMLAGLETFDDPNLGSVILAGYSAYPAALKKRALQVLTSRPVWANQLVQALEEGQFARSELSLDQARGMVALGDKQLTARVEKLFGKFAPATAGEKQARIAALNATLSREKSADAARGRILFTKLCAACHQLHGEGGQVGPDLTTVERKNRGYLLAQIVDPSGYIRPEYVVQNVLTVDERTLSGIAREIGESIELLSVINNQAQKTVLAKKDIAAIQPSTVSLMPEQLLDTLTDAQIADLFAYLQADAPKTSGTAAPKLARGETKKLQVCLVSGSFEYQSDASLGAFQKYLEENFSVACSQAFAKSEKEIAGLEHLKDCDVAIFFTRRLTIDGEPLEVVKQFVKSGKPIIGLRTASHGFQNWLAMDQEVFGGSYRGHYGDKQTCEIKIVEAQKNHPLLKGCSSFQSGGSLYQNPNVAADVTVLLTGAIPGHSEPVAWTREIAGRRVFYTSLGHPDDFKNENFTRLLVNALAWVTKADLKPMNK